MMRPMLLPPQLHTPSLLTTCDIINIMIAIIRGTVDYKLIDRIVIDVHGVGYEVFINDTFLGDTNKGHDVKLYIREQIKEDAHDLYGFASIEEKQLFEKLLSVKNVGPRVAMAVLNIGQSEKVRQAIAGGDTNLLQTAKGVGRRAAEQIVVELRDKVGLVSSSTADAIAGRGGDIEKDEAVEALVSLGYNIYDARTALSGVSKDLSLEDRVKQALKGGK